MRRNNNVLIAVFILFYIFSVNISYAKNDRAKLSKLIIQTIERWHYSGKSLNKDFAEEGYKEFIKTLDYDKRFLLKSDVDLLNENIDVLNEELKSGKTELMKLAFKIKDKRINEVVDFYPEILKQEFDFSKKEYIETNPEKRNFCKDLAQLKDYWRKILKYRVMTRYLRLKTENDKKEENKLSDKKIREKAKTEILKSTKRILTQIKKAGEKDSYSRYLNSILSVFDPHTSYFPPKDKQDFDIEMSGSLEGIGALLTQENDFVKIVEIIPGGPAWKQKQLGPEDKILKVAQENKEPVDIVGMRTTDAVKLIRGKKGTLVKLTVKKPDGRIMEIPIIRDIVIIEETFVKSIIIKGKDNKRIGFVVLKSFYDDFFGDTGRNSYDDVKRELEKLKRKGVDGIVFDLRGNRGGALTDAVKISGLFIKEGPIVQVQGRVTGKETLKDPDPDIQYEGPMLVLVNTLSASASEIMAAALQDYNRAVVVGDSHSFGKGTVQVFLDLNRIKSGEYEELENPGALKLTIKKFYRINGGSNQYKGIIPDIVLPGIYDSFDVGERFLDHSLKWDTISPVNYVKFKKYKFNIDILKSKSLKRINKNSYFQELISYNKELIKRKNKTIQSLNIDDIIKEQEYIKKKVNKIKKMKIENNTFSFDFPDKLNKLKDKKLIKIEKDRRNNWIKSIKKDMVLFESINILKDIIANDLLKTGKE